MVLNTKVKNIILASTGAAAAMTATATVASADSITVAKGDTLWSLAKSNNTTVDKIVSDNGISNQDLIVTGQEIKVNEEVSQPAENTSAQAVSEKNADGTVTVVAGDTLYGIAARFNVSVDTLIANNNGSTIINPGQKLSLEAAPVQEEAAAPAPEAAPAPQAAQAAPVQQTTSAPQSSVTASGSWVDVAKSILGIPYVWGGASTAGFDCSGFVQYVRAHSGQSNLGRTTYQQAATLRSQGSQPKSLSQAQPGDLLFWGGVGSEYHVEIYLGGGQSIGATQPGENSSIHSVWGNPVAYSN